VTGLGLTKAEIDYFKDMNFIGIPAALLPHGDKRLLHWW